MVLKQKQETGSMKKKNLRFGASLVPRPSPSFPSLAEGYCNASDWKLGKSLGTRLAGQVLQLGLCVEAGMFTCQNWQPFFYQIWWIVTCQFWFDSKIGTKCISVLQSDSCAVSANCGTKYNVHQCW